MSEIPDLAAAVAKSDPWCAYPLTVYPQHTDYAGVVWHGTYVAWLEAARVEWLQLRGLEFADLVTSGCDLPVVKMSLHYHQSLRMGNVAIVRTRLHNLGKIRMEFEQKVQSVDSQITYFTGLITLVAVDRTTGKIMRQLPPAVQEALSK
jgi:acyl-CoA thioester hydrolase